MPSPGQGELSEDKVTGTNCTIGRSCEFDHFSSVIVDTFGNIDEDHKEDAGG